VLLVEQNVHTAVAVADRAYVLEKGRVTLATTTEELRRDRVTLEQRLGVGA
jgi:branched-chain amino acid transport system ATP-binding protein